METELILKGEEMLKKLDKLTEVKADSENWLIYYSDEGSNEKWVVVQNSRLLN